MKNADIEVFLKQYVETNNHPGYGILISGEWGVGKTHFLKKIIDSLSESKKVIYISLYGMSKTSQIDDEFFKLLHPILGSKISKFAGRIAKLAVKATLKIDLDGDKKDDISVDMQIPSIDLNALVEMSKNVIIIIDDLERSNIEYPLLFGYINHLVEHEELKTIIAGHEQVVKNKFEQYKLIKEKTIGKTFTITADYDSAIHTFLSSVSTFTVKKILQQRRNMILDVFLSSEYNNLRFLKQFYIEFEVIILKLKKRIKSDEFIDAFLKQYLIFCIEYKGGFLQYEDFNDMDSNPYTIEKKETKISQIREKYKHIEDFKYILNSASWRDIVIHGCIDEASIDQQVNDSSFFTSDERKMPIWRMLWESRLLNDEDFDFAVEQAKIILKNKTSTKVGEILHITSSFIQFIENDVVDIEVNELEAMAKDAIQNAIETANYDFESNSHSCGDDFASTWSGHYYTNYENPKIISLTSYATDLLNKKISFEREDIAADLFSRLDHDPEKFIKEIYFNSESTTSLNEMPFLNYISPQDFIDKVIKLPPKNRSRVAAALTRRYAPGSAFRKLTAEKEWILLLKQKTMEKIENSTGASKLFAIDFLNHTLTNVETQLNNAQAEIKNTHPIH
ncbi:TPA: P-loop NTPase fold protein [Enterobacter bugandensis]